MEVMLSLTEILLCVMLIQYFLIFVWYKLVSIVQTGKIRDKSGSFIFGLSHIVSLLGAFGS